MSDPPDVGPTELVLVWGFMIGAVLVVIALVLVWLWN